MSKLLLPPVYEVHNILEEKKNTQLHMWDKHKRVIHITQWTMSMNIVHGVLLSPLYRSFSLILPWRAFKLSTYHCKTWIHITKMQLIKLYPSLYQELFQNTQTNSDIIESQCCRKIYSWKWYCQNFRTQPTDLSSCSAQERTFSEILAPQTTITACFTNVRSFYWKSGRSLPCLVHSLTHCNALNRQSTHACI